MHSQLAEVSLKCKTSTPIEKMPLIQSPQEAVQLLRKVWDEDSLQLKEEFVVGLLNNAKRCLDWSKISSCGASTTIVDPAQVFQLALLRNASSIILAHNHPSGLLQEFAADVNLANRILKGGRLLGKTVDDHIILYFFILSISDVNDNNLIRAPTDQAC